MNLNLKKLTFCLLIPMLTGTIATMLTHQHLNIYTFIIQAPLSFQIWLFPIVWAFLYLFIGISMYCVIDIDAEDSHLLICIALFLILLILNFIWPFLFYNFQWYLLSLLCSISILFYSFFLIVAFYWVSHIGSLLLIPYCLWMVYLSYLSFYICFFI